MGPGIYGFVELDAIEDSTESFNDAVGNVPIARPGTYAGDHARSILAVPNSRLGFKWNAPEEGALRVSGVVELDFLGPYPSNTAEVITFTSPFARLRHAWLKLETPIVDLTVGQTWQLLGWQPYFHVNTVAVQGVPAQVYSRAPQIRVSRSLRGDDVTLEIAAALARAPQRDSAVPDVQAGLKLTVNGLKGVRTYGATGTVVDALAVGVSGAMRWFRVPEFAEHPTAAVTALGWAISVDALVPIICAGPGDRGNALTLTSSFADGAGDADFYTALNGGITFPPLPNPNGITPAPSYAPNIDNGLVVFDGAGELVVIRWWSFIAGVQYYLPPSGRMWLALNYSHLHSPNIARLGSPAAVFATSNWVDGNLLFDATKSVRFGAAYGFSEQTYGDGVKAHNHRVQVSGFFLF